MNGGRPATPWLILLCAAWILPGLVGHDPWKPDEAYGFGLVYSLLTGGDWVALTLAGEPFVEKPPLFYLSSALLAWLTSPLLPLHDGARLATGLYGAATLVLTGLAGRELYGRGHGWTAALLLLGCFGLLVRMHQLITDAALLTGFALALYGLALALRRPVLAGALLGAGAGIGFLSKGFLAPGILGVLAMLLPLFTPWRTRAYARALGTATLAVLPWLLVWPYLLYLRSPQLFNDWLTLNNFEHFWGYAGFGAATQPFYYLAILPWFAWPALPVALWTLWAGGRAALKRPEIQLPLAAFLVMLAMLSAAEARDVYALPMLLPLSLLAAAGIPTLRRGAANALYWFSLTGFTFFIGVIWFYWFALEFGMPARLHLHLHKLQPGYSPGLKLLPLTIGLVYTAGWIAVLLFLKRGPQRPVVAWAAGMTVAWALVMSLLLGWIDTAKSYRSMVVSLERALPAKHRCIASRSLGEPQRAMLQYYAGLLTERIEAPKSNRQCDLLLVQTTAKDKRAPQGPWRLVWEGNRPGDKVERYRLYRRP